MTNLILSPDDATLAALRELANREHITPEELALRLLKESVQQHETPKYAAVGLFASGKTDTSERGEEILESEWNPDQTKDF